MTPEEFYDALAPDYEDMTASEGRLLRETELLRPLVLDWKVRTAVDAGTGTGLHARALARLGVHVVAVDVSRAMLERLPARDTAEGRLITPAQADLRSLDREVAAPVDALLCLGNTLPHLRTDADLAAVLGAFRRAVKPGGRVVVQLLNFDRLLASGERVQHVRETDGVIFIRFYDFLPDCVRFNLLLLRREGGTLRPTLRSVDLRPLTRALLARSCAAAGFSDLTWWSSLAGAPLAPDARDVVLVAS
jgi:SAM-dependent methyltransferase